MYDVYRGGKKREGEKYSIGGKGSGRGSGRGGRVYSRERITAGVREDLKRLTEAAGTGWSWLEPHVKQYVAGVPGIWAFGLKMIVVR